MDLTPDLISQVRQGRAVLFLGAGATRKAKAQNGKEPPLGDELRDRIAERFLTDKYTSEALMWVAELAISASSLFQVHYGWLIQLQNPSLLWSELAESQPTLCFQVLPFSFSCH